MRNLLNTLLLGSSLGCLTSARLYEDGNRNLEGDSFSDKIKDFFTDERCLRVEKDLTNLKDMSSWMSKLENADSLRIMDLTIPGSHNSNSFDLSTDLNKNDPEYQNSDIKEGTFNLNENFVSQWICEYALTQSLSLSEQLQAGMRYLDLRFDYDAATEQFRATHLLFGLPAVDLINQVAAFAKDHPKEIVFLEVGPIYANITVEKKQELQRLITNTLAGMLIPTSTDLNTVTLGQLQNNESNVFVIVSDDDVVGDSNLLWHNQDVMKNTYEKTDNVDTLMSFNTDRLNEFQAREKIDEFHKLQWIITPSIKYIQENPLEGSLYNLAKEANSKLGEFQRNIGGSKQLGNILIVDYVETSPLMMVLGLETYSDGTFVPEPVDPQSKWTGAAKAGLAVGVIMFCCGLGCLYKFCKKKKNKDGN